MINLKSLAISAVLAATAISYAHADDTIIFDGFPDFDSSLNVIKPAFEKQTGIKVDEHMSNFDDHHKKLFINLATYSNAGDVAVIDVEKVGDFVSSGGLVNLSKKYHAEQYKQDFPPYAWAQGEDPKGDVYGIPVDLGPGVMFYRRDLLEQNGDNIDHVISNWDSYIAYGEKLKKHDIYLIASASDVAQAIIYTTVKDGEGLYFDKNGLPIVTSPRFVKAFTVAKKIRDKGLDAHITSWSNEWYDGFLHGKFATQLSGAWFLGHLKDNLAPKSAGKWRVSNLPDGIYGSWGGSFLSIPESSEHQDEAWELIKYMTTKRSVQLQHFATIGAFPANIKTYDDPAFSEPVPYLGGQKARLLFADITMKIKPVMPTKGDSVARSIIFDNALLQVLDENKDINQALADAQRILEQHSRNF